MRFLRHWLTQLTNVVTRITAKSTMAAVSGKNTNTMISCCNFCKVCFDLQAIYKKEDRLLCSACACLCFMGGFDLANTTFLPIRGWKQRGHAYRGDMLCIQGCVNATTGSWLQLPMNKESKKKLFSPSMDLSLASLFWQLLSAPQCLEPTGT